MKGKQVVATLNSNAPLSLLGDLTRAAAGDESVSHIVTTASGTATKARSRSASLKSWSIIEESYYENLDLLLGDFFSHQ
jgi:hypothetical protein